MKFPIVLLAAASLVAAESPTQVIIGQINRVINATITLTDAIASFEGFEQAAPLLAANTAVLDTVNNGTNVILALQDQVPLADALLLPPPTLRLGQLVNASITTIINKQPVFTEFQLGSITYQSLQTLNCASDRFTNATLSRLPGGGINLVSAELTAPIFSAFSQGIAAYRSAGGNSSAPVNCSPVDATSRGLAKVDQSGAAMLGASQGVSVVVAAALAGLMLL